MNIKRLSVGLVLVAGLLAGLIFVYAQDTTLGQSNMSDAQIELMAIEQVPPTPYSQLSESDQAGGTFWSAQHSPVSAEPWPPLPMDPRQLPVWSLSTNSQDQGVFLLDDLSVNYNSSSTTTAQTAGTMQTLDATNPPSPGDTNSYSTNSGPIPLGTGTPIDTNGLWLQINGVSNGLVYLTLNNTTNGVQYQILSQEALSNAPMSSWDDEGSLFWGSSTTNWTAVTVPQNGRSNLFLSAQSQIDTTGTGIPDWWWLKYFGQDTNVDAYGDPAGDGWNNLEKYQFGMDPNQFYTPAAPQGVTVEYNPANNTATISWLPSAGSVTGYTVTRNNNGTLTTFPVSGTSFTDSTQPETPNPNYPYEGPVTYNPTYQVQANYTGGYISDTSDAVPLLSMQNAVSFNVLTVSQNYGTLAVSSLPQNVVALQVTRYSPAPEGDTQPWLVTTFEVPVSSLTNGMYAVSNDASDVWWLQTVDQNGTPSDATIATPVWTGQPFYDGREQLRQNLTFLLREPNAESPFSYVEYDTNGLPVVSYTAPTNYAYAGLYDFTYNEGLTYNTLNVYRPFEDNYLYRNFVFSTADVDTSGSITTGVGEQPATPGYPSVPPLILQDPATYQFQQPVDGSTNISALLATNQAQWLVSFPFQPAFPQFQQTNNIYLDLTPIGITYTIDPNTGLVFTLANDALNYFGLPYQSVNVAYQSTDANGNPTGNLETQTLSPGRSFPVLDQPYLYPQTAQPQFQTVEYDFWGANLGYYDASGYWQWFEPLPNDPGFSPTNRIDPLIIQIGQTSVPNPLGGSYPLPTTIQVAGYAKLAVTNGYPGVYGYLGQYFEHAYQIDDNGNVTTNTTGILSPYGDFFPTKAGPVALVTMPDPDTGEQGTATVYVVKLQLDVNHDGVMDLSYNGPDNTSPNNPYVFWANNNYDRWEVDILSGVPEQDDVLVGDPDSLIPDADPYDPDCNYKDNGQRVIPDTRDLEDFARLWVCGVTSNLLATLPAGSTVTLNWGDVGSPNSANPTIDIFQAADPDGGIGYLTNEVVAEEQTNQTQALYVGRLGPGGSLLLNSSLFANDWAGNHFIWCGVSNGVGQLNLTISDASGRVLAQASQWIQIVDIKQMYERWTVGDDPYKMPSLVATNACNDLPDYLQQPFRYSTNTIPNTPYILFVHGWNMERWEKDRYAETAFKRLYWQGYQGRFGEFRWPTYYDFPFGAFSWQAFDLRNYDNSEYNAWQSGAGLLNLLTNLDAEYQSANVYLIAHSMGNVVAGEALLLAGSNQVVNTYVAMQAAVPAHCYDSSTPDIYAPNYPDDYAQYWTAGAPSYFNGSASAGAYVNFFNTNDFALNEWTHDQNLKPDYGYGYDGTNFYYAPTLLSTTYFHFPQDTFDIFAYCDPAPCYALGAQAGVEGAFNDNQVNLSASPYDFGSLHIYHSGEFRSDYAQRWQFWNEVLTKMSLKQPL